MSCAHAGEAGVMHKYFSITVREGPIVQYNNSRFNICHADSIDLKFEKNECDLISAIDEAASSREALLAASRSSPKQPESSKPYVLVTLESRLK